jgi:hypothetical protein
MRNNPWIVDIILVLWNRDPRIGMTEGELVWNLRILRHKSGVKLPEAFDATVRSIINNHTSQSDVWRKNGERPEDDILHSPEGKGSGTWAIKRRDRAMAKLINNGYVTPEQLAEALAEVRNKLGKKSPRQISREQAQ